MYNYRTTDKKDTSRVSDLGYSAKNGGGYDFYANNAKFPIDDDASVMIP